MVHTNIPLILSFRYSIVKDFKVYKKSRINPLEFDISEYRPTDLWAEEIVKKENFCKDLILAFIDDSRLCILPDKHSYNYRFGNGVLQIYDIQQKEWIPFAYGDENKLVITQQLTSIGNASLQREWFSNKQNEIFNNVLNCSNGIPATSKFKDNKDLVAWCNIHYVFQ